MALEKQEYVERVVVVMNPDGSLAGASEQVLSRILEDGVDIAQPKYHTPTALTEDALKRLLPSRAALMAQNSAQQAELIAMQEALVQSAETIEHLRQSVALLDARTRSMLIPVPADPGRTDSPIPRPATVSMQADG